MEIKEIRELISRGETGKALEALIALIEKDSRYKDNLLRTLRVIEANFNAARQQEQKGILSFQEAQREYSRVTDTALAALDDLEAGRVPVAARPAAAIRWKYSLAAGGLLLVAALAAWLVFGRDNNCPRFDEPAALHILVLPFDNLVEEAGNLRPENRIQNEITALTAKAKIAAEVKISSREMEGNMASFAQNAVQQGRRCQADLVVYGQFRAFRDDSIRVNMGYRFLKGQGAEVNLPFKTFRDITDVQVPRDLEDALFSLCAMIAVREEKFDVARRWMGRIKEKDPGEVSMTEWLAEK